MTVDLDRGEGFLVGYGALGHRLGTLLRSFDCESMIFDKYTPDARLRKLEELDRIFPGKNKFDILLIGGHFDDPTK